jgi:hypothetical protein
MQSHICNCLATCNAGSAKTDAIVQAALEDQPRERKLAEYRARLLNVVKASYGEC